MDDSVLQIVAPRYNAYPLHDGGHASGEVVVDVNVDASGSVIEASIVSSPDLPLLPDEAKSAAFRWKFEPSTQSDERVFRLRFLYDGNVRTDSPRGVRTWYENPLTLHVEYIEPTVELIERVDGQIPERRCDKHGVPMQVERLPIHYGLWMYDKDQVKQLKPYWEAKRREFPNAHTIARRGDIVFSETEAEVYVCQMCIEAREDWLDRHPNRETEP